MKKLLSILLLAIFITNSAQEVVVTGNVSDGVEALSGILVTEKGTSNKTTTDANGDFQISSHKGATLLFSHNDFTPYELPVEKTETLDIILTKKDIHQLSEISVKGFPSVIGKARKRVASIQATPETVTAFNSDGIEKAGINNLADFSALVPNLQLNEAQAIGVNFLTVRGIPQIRNTDAPVAFVIDGVTIADPALLNQELFDLALVEVVKGPQGALYGKNAIGGAINIYSKEPTNAFKNKLTLGYGNGNAREGSFISSGAIVKNKIFYRFSTQLKDFDGLLTNEYLDKKVDFKKNFTTRGQLTFRVSPDFKINTTVQYIDASGGATYYSIAPTSVNNNATLTYLDPNPKKGNNVISQDILGDSDMKNFYTNLNMEYSLNNVKIQSITSYSDVDRSTFGDLDFTEVFYLDQGETNDSKAFNQEIRLSNINQNSKLDWSLGGFYQNTKRNFYQSDYTMSPDWVVTDYKATFKTFALFGFLDYKVTDKLTLSAGLRFDSDDFTQNDYLNEATNKMTENVLQPKVSIAYQATKDALFYANYGRGYRAGGFNPKTTDLFNSDFKGETSDNYEVGIKTAWWNNRLILNGSAFYSNFKNRQQFAITSDDFTPGNFNYVKSEILGIEFDTKTRVSKYLDLLFSYGLIKSTILEGGYTGGTDGMATDLNQYNGNDTSWVPQSNFNAGIESNIPIGEKKSIDISINYNGTGKIYWEDSNNSLYTSKAYQLLNARAALSINKIKLSLWARNILNKQYYLEYSSSGYGWRGTPATFGTTISFKF